MNGWLTIIWHTLSLCRLQLHLPIIYHLLSFITNDRTITSKVKRINGLDNEQ